MKIISQRREQARWAYDGAVLEVKKEIPVQYFEERIGGSRSFSIAAAVDAVLLMTTTAIAFYFIRQDLLAGCPHEIFDRRVDSVATAFVPRRETEYALL